MSGSRQWRRRGWLMGVVGGLCLGVPVGLGSAAPTVSGSPARVAAFDHQHAGLKPALTAVSGGRVDYRHLAQQRASLDAYLTGLASVTPEQLSGFTRSQQLAFWLNAYNARVLQRVVSAPGLKSIRDLPGVFDREAFTVAGQSLTLDRLENEVIRKGFKDPRVHFVLNCGAKSCPPLQREPLVGDRLSEQLDQAARAFLRDPAQVQVNVKTGEVAVSRLLEWFEGDFAAARPVPARAGLSAGQASMLAFVAGYLEPGAGQTLLLQGPVKLRYLDYDWALNSR